MANAKPSDPAKVDTVDPKVAAAKAGGVKEAAGRKVTEEVIKRHDTRPGHGDVIHEVTRTTYVDSRKA